MPLPLLILEQTGSLLPMNKSARQLFADGSPTALGMPALAEIVQQSVPGRSTSTSLTTRSGLRTYSINVADVWSNDGLVRLAALLDVQAEMQVAEAAALKDMVEILSHEILNSLSAMTSLSETLASTLEDTPEIDAKLVDAARIVALRGDGLMRFVDGYRDLARVPDPTPQEVTFQRVLDDAKTLFVAQWADSATLHVAHALPTLPIRVDLQLLLQALSTITTNAVEAARDHRRFPVVSIEAALTENGRPVFYIDDNGPGLGASMTDLFRPFFTTKPEGRGIGLGIARQIARAHGGNIVAGDRQGPEGGARFTLQL